MKQSKTLLSIDERGLLIIDRYNIVVNCHLSSVRRQMAIESSVSNDFLSTFVDSINIFDCRLSRVKPKHGKHETHFHKNM